MKPEDKMKQNFANEQSKAVMNIVFTAGWIYSSYAKSLKPYGLTTQQFNILRILKRMYPQPASVNLLIEKMIDKMSNASRLVDKLKIKELVERRVNKKDKRQVDVVITQKGIELLVKLDAVMIMDHNKNFMSITENEAAEINRILDKIRGDS